MTVRRLLVLWLAAVWACPLSAAPTSLRIAVVPIVNQGHFLDEMLAGFAAREQVTLQIDAQHGRKAVAAVRARAVDLVITHADFNGMAALVHAGDVQASEVVFANPIALLGPAADPAGIATARTPEEALARIATAQRCVVPNDLQHLREFAPSPPARCDAPAGTGLAAIQTAVRTHAYVWWGLHPFLLSGQPLTPTVWADPRLLRPLMAWIPAGPRTALAARAVAELRSHEIQQRLGSFRFSTHPSLQVWWPYRALDRLAALRARGTLRVAMKNPGARAAADHRDPAHVAKRAFEMEIAAALTASILGDPARLQPIRCANQNACRR